ncbi:MAG TPA: SUMF1/EgtB/PvdO family nonheme iron enzyme [Polyangium sp.]|nr:SUMF1/EgtB/PvdO family nonheme iron enzyme [Polyangium sp.]
MKFSEKVGGIERQREMAFLWGLATVLIATGCGTDATEGAGGAGGLGGSGGFVDETKVATNDFIDESAEVATQALSMAPPLNGTACTSGTQCPTGYCVDGFCCDQKCDNKCMACSVAKKGSGVDGICGSIAYDTDPDNDCPVGACDGKNQCKNYNSVACISAAQCLSNYCVDGVCCNNICMGSCQACTAAKKGSGQDGVCSSIKAATDPDNECSNSDCNGSGACTTTPQPTFPNGTPCTSATQCASGYCADGVCCDSWCLGSCQACTGAKKNQGTDGTCGPVANDKDPDDECWGGACNGAGVCKQYNGVPCTDKTQCLSNFCVDGFCCGNICTGWCYACSEARKGGGYDGVCAPILSGRDPDSECTPGECNGSGACNQTQTPLTNGTACIASAQCASGNCVDGFCCDTACTGTCQACSATKKGSGANGTCGNIASATDPDSECGYGGQCGGNGTCKFYNSLPCTSATQCFSGYCADGVCCGNICNQTCYACSAAKKGQGTDGACGPIANTKDPDNECNPGECNGSGACNQLQTPQANGASCTLATQCASGNCVDGVCCDTACTGTCNACSAAKKGQGANGTCGPIKYDTDPDDECFGGACSGSGTCRYYNGVACTAAMQCLSSYCVDGFCCGNICNGICQACSNAKKGNGYDGICASIVADTDPDNECALTCNGSGACRGQPGDVCTTNSDCIAPSCVNGTCAPPSCIGMPATCGVPNNEDCCASLMVPGGTYNRSNDTMYPATVSDFRLDRFEVTVGRFRKFVEAYPASKPVSGAGSHPVIPGIGWDSTWDVNLPADQAALKAAVNCSSFATWTDTAGANEQLPMNCISWYLSFAFCAWDGGRIPTEAEWNYAAAGGSEQRAYPWSNPPNSPTIDPSYAVYDCMGDGSSAGSCTFADILRVGSKPNGNAKWGHADLTGSVSEWTLDWYYWQYPNPCNDCVAGGGNTKSSRGGSWYGCCNLLYTSDRAATGYPDSKNSMYGARCARKPQ